MSRHYFSIVNVLSPPISAAFSYAKSSYNQGESDPTPTITGTTGGTFTGTSGIVFVDSGGSADSSTGQIDLSASSIATHTVTYTVSGVSSNFELGITAVPYSSTRSFSFDGVDSYFNVGTGVGDSFGNSYTGGLSVSLWFKANTTSADDGLIWFSSNPSNSHGSFSLNISANRIRVRNVASSIITFTDTTSWHHLSAVMNSSAATTGKLYLDGALQSASFSYSSINLLSNVLYIGTYYNTSSCFNGNIDEVSIWDSALSSSAITEIYNSGAPNDLESLTNASSSNLVAWYKMGE